MEEIPSPYLSNIFKGNYKMAILETNRGCPFKCSFCFWGAATNDRVYKFDEERSKKEITWISDSGIPFLFIADANWGMLKRDIELSRHLAACREKYAMPVFVYFSSAKNSHNRVSEITQIFKDSKLISQHPISLQTLSPNSLEVIQRKNIKQSAYENLQEDLNKRGINSFIELIWPLPGESLSSFKEGIEYLFEKRASNFVVYGHLLLHNTPMFEQKDLLELTTVIVSDEISESEVVINTKQLKDGDFQKGFWFYYCVLAIYNTKSLENLLYYLHEKETISFKEIITTFYEHCLQFPNHPFTKYCNQSIENFEFVETANYSFVYQITLHNYRLEFEALLFQFVSNQIWWQDPNAQLAFELDILNRPYLYKKSICKPNIEFSQIEIIEVSEEQYLITSPIEYLNGSNDFESAPRSKSMISIKFPTRLSFYNPTLSKERMGDYCYGKIMNIKEIHPKWSLIKNEELILTD